MQYLNFDVEIGPGGGREYPITVRSQAGESRVTMRFPLDELALKDAHKDLQIALLRSSGVRRQSLAPEAKTVQSFGQNLFDSLIAGEVRALYDVSRREAGQKGMGVRLRLMIQAPELAALPWEYLYDARLGAYICLSRNTPVVRYLEVAQAIHPLAVTPPLRMLVMIASPSDQDTLDVQRERRRLQEALGSLEQQGLLKLRWLEGQTWRDVQRAMQQGPWHIFHFIGHGGYDERRDEGVLALANDEGKTHLLTATQVGTLLADHSSLRLVVLNACEGAKGSSVDLFSSTSATLARRGLPAVLAMQYEITDTAAIEFTRTFYETVARGKPVDEAASEARKAVELENANTVEWGTPVLYLRAPDGRLFDMPEQIELTSLPAKAPPPPPIAPQTPSPASERPVFQGGQPTKLCIKCATPLPFSSGFCGNCGTRQPPPSPGPAPSRPAPVLGVPVYPSAMPLLVPRTPTPYSTPSAPPKPGLSRRKAILGILLVLVLVSSGVGVFLATRHTATPSAGTITEFRVPTFESFPIGITSGPDGNLWFTEGNGNRIGRITPSGKITEFPLSIGVNTPWGITAGPDGNLWFTEETGNHIERITPSGKITEFSLPASGSGPTQVGLDGITTGPDGNLWFTENTGNRIGRITPSGIFTEFPVPTRSSAPDGITAGPDGNLWFTENDGNQIGRITPSGTITEFPVPSRGSGPDGITKGPDGNLWFTESDGNQIGRITPSGTITEFPVPSSGSNPWEITKGPDGNLWFTEQNSNQIGRITPG